MVEGYIAAGEAQGATREQVIEGFASVHPMKRLGTTAQRGRTPWCSWRPHKSSFTTGADLPVDGGYLA